MKQKDDTMKETPETDAASNELGMYGNIVAVNFARGLERQRDEARRLARELRDALKQITDQDEENFQLGYQALGPFVVQVARNALIKAKEVLGEA